ncbi:MAG: histidinol-phosphatase [Ruminococcus sp.]|nr:histidinol-phosphatase [Ruminococcus sp.]
MILRDYHVHTHLCDGSSTPEETVLSAIEKGLATLGFSGHNTLENEDWCMSPEGITEYKKEIRRLKEKYRDKIEILCGIEQDYYSPSALGYDYIIGSVHCLKVSEGLASLDDTAEKLRYAVDKYFGGDSLSLAEEYFRTVADVKTKTGALIVGHFDLIEKFSDTDPLFDTSHPRYIKAAEEAIDRLVAEGAIFEVNTGAMVRGYRQVPYPASPLLGMMQKKGADVILTSDCHDAKNLCFAFDKALELIKGCGFCRLAYISQGEVKYTKI